MLHNLGPIVAKVMLALAVPSQVNVSYPLDDGIQGHVHFCHFEFGHNREEHRSLSTETLSFLEPQLHSLVRFLKKYKWKNKKWNAKNQ